MISSTPAGAAQPPPAPPPSLSIAAAGYARLPFEDVNNLANRYEGSLRRLIWIHYELVQCLFLFLFYLTGREDISGRLLLQHGAFRHKKNKHLRMPLPRLGQIMLLRFSGAPPPGVEQPNRRWSVTLSRMDILKGKCVCSSATLSSSLSLSFFFSFCCADHPQLVFASSCSEEEYQDGCFACNPWLDKMRRGAARRKARELVEGPSSTVDNLYAQLPEQPEGYAHPHHHHHGHHLHRVTDLLTVARGLQQEDERLKGVQAEEMLGETLRKEGGLSSKNDIRLSFLTLRELPTISFSTSPWILILSLHRVPTHCTLLYALCSRLFFFRSSFFFKGNVFFPPPLCCTSFITSHICSNHHHKPMAHWDQTFIYKNKLVDCVEKRAYVYVASFPEKDNECVIRMILLRVGERQALSNLMLNAHKRKKKRKFAYTFSFGLVCGCCSKEGNYGSSSSMKASLLFATAEQAPQERFDEEEEEEDLSKESHWASRGRCENNGRYGVLGGTSPSAGRLDVEVTLFSSLVEVISIPYAVFGTRGTNNKPNDALSAHQGKNTTIMGYRDAATAKQTRRRKKKQHKDRIPLRGYIAALTDPLLAYCMNTIYIYRYI
eukprot:gene12214-8403_t